jgi:hypothetical protein
MRVLYCSSIRAVLLVRDLKLGGLPKTLLTSSYTYKSGEKVNDSLQEGSHLKGVDSTAMTITLLSRL